MLIRNCDSASVLAHARGFPMFFVKATPQKTTLESDLQVFSSTLPPLTLRQYAAQFKPISLQHICQSGPNVIVSLSHAICDGALMKQFLNSLGSDVLLSDDLDPKSPAEIFENDLKEILLEKQKENRLCFSGNKKSGIMSTQFKAQLGGWVNEKINLVMSLLVQEWNARKLKQITNEVKNEAENENEKEEVKTELEQKERKTLIGVGNMVDLRQFASEPGLFLNFISGFNFPVEVNETDPLQECFLQLRTALRSLELKDYLNYWKAIQTEEWSYFSTSKDARVEVSNVGRLLKDAEMMITADEAFSTLSVMLYSYENELRGNVQHGANFEGAGVYFAKNIEKLLAKCSENITVADLRQ